MKSQKPKPSGDDLPVYELRALNAEDRSLTSALTAIAVQAKSSWGYPEAWIEAWSDDLTITIEHLTRCQIWAAFEAGTGSGNEAGAAPAGFTVLDPAVPVAGLEHFWIAPDHQGRGLGRSLFERLRRDAEAAGAEVLEVVSDPNAEGFYRRLGFAPHARLRADVLGEERYLPVLRLTLDP